MNLKNAWSRYRWVAGGGLLACALVSRLWFGGVLPEMREVARSRQRLDSLEQLRSRLPELQERWKRLAARKERIASPGRDSAAVTRIQRILLQSGLLSGGFRVEAVAGEGRLPVLLKGGFLDIAKVMRTLEAEGAVPVEWEMRPVSSSELEGKITLRVQVMEAAE